MLLIFTPNTHTHNHTLYILYHTKLVHSCPTLNTIRQCIIHSTALTTTLADRHEVNLHFHTYIHPAKFCITFFARDISNHMPSC